MNETDQKSPPRRNPFDDGEAGETRAAAYQRRTQRRTRQILRFRACQERRRDWIGFWDIADWIASERGTRDRRDERLRAQGFDDLLAAALAREFDDRGKSRILWLAPQAELRCFSRRRWERESKIGQFADPPSDGLRLSQERLREMVDRFAGTGTVAAEVLPRCWVPRSLVRRWFDRRGIVWPGIFDPPPDASEAMPAALARQHPRRTFSVLQSAIEDAISANGWPGQDVQWGEFCRLVRLDCKVSEKNPPRGYGDKSISRAVRALKSARRVERGPYNQANLECAGSDRATASHQTTQHPPS